MIRSLVVISLIIAFTGYSFKSSSYFIDKNANRLIIPSYCRTTETSMILKELRAFFSNKEPTAKITVGSAPPVDVPERVLFANPVISPSFQMREAHRRGLSPVNFDQLLQQFPLEELQNAVLFDTTPMAVTPGNHWRILSVDDEHHKVNIRLCGPFGNHDVRDIPPFSVSKKDVLFTGINRVQYEKDKQPVSLDAVNDLVMQAGYGTDNFMYPRNLRLTSEAIYFANSQGQLVIKERRYHKPGIMRGYCDF